jgi:hypothetical protein
VSASTFLCSFGAGFAHALAGEIEAMGVVDEAVEDGVGIGRVPEYHMMPLTLIGESLTLRLLTPVTPYLEPVYG